MPLYDQEDKEIESEIEADVSSILTAILNSNPGNTRDTGNEQTSPLAAGATFSGTYKKIDNYQSVQILYAATTPITSVKILWSNDGVTQIPGLFGSSTLTQRVVSGYNVVYQVYSGDLIAPYYKLEVVNGASPQGPIPFFLSINWLNNSPYNGSYDFLDGSLTNLSKALLTRSVQAGIAPDGTFNNIPISGVDLTNSTTVQLAGGATYTGTVKDITGWEQLQIIIISDQPSATSGIQMHFSQDGITFYNANADFTHLGTGESRMNEAGTAGVRYFQLSPAGKYFRMRYINGATPTTLLAIQIILLRNSAITTIRRVGDSISNDTSITAVKSVISGANPDGSFSNQNIQGRDSDNSASTPLVANATYRGLWFEWQANYVKLLTDLDTDVGGTLYIDFSEELSPVDGDDSSVDDSVIITYNPVLTPLFRRQTPVQSRWVRHRYINGNAAQSELLLDAAFLTSDPGLVAQRANIQPLLTDQVGVVRNVPSVGDGTGLAYHDLPVDEDGVPKVTIGDIDDDILLRPLPTAQTRQVTAGITAVQMDMVKLSGRRAISIMNHSATINGYFGYSSGLNSNNGVLIPPLCSKARLLSDVVDIWIVAQNTGGTQSTLDRNGASASGTATSPSNALTDNGSYATMANIQTIIIDGYTAGTANTLVSVKMGIKGHKNSSPATETVGFIDVVTGTAGNVGTVVSGTVTSNSSHFYLVAISRRNAAANVTSVSGLGLTWTQVQTVTGNGNDSRIDLWKGVGTPTGNGAVTASFSVVATNSVIGVYRYSNVDSTTPIQNSETLNTVSATASYADAIDGTNLGMAATFVSMVQRTHTAGSGFTEQNETRTGTATSDASLAGNTLALAATGSQAYSGTFSGTVNWCLIAVTLTPATTIAPVITLTYKLSAVLGATSGTATLSSTSDTSTLINITSDRTWVFADIANVQITATAAITTATALIDWIYLELVDSTGNVIVCSLEELSGPIT